VKSLEGANAGSSVMKIEVAVNGVTPSFPVLYQVVRMKVVEIQIANYWIGKGEVATECEGIWVHESLLG
jgi:hypothetical protein